MRGISSAKYWEALILLGSQVKLLQTGEQAERNKEIIRSLDTQILNNKTICVHMRGKRYELRRDERSKVGVVLRSVLLALESVKEIRERGVPISGISIITLMEVQSVWGKMMQHLSVKDKAVLGEMTVAVIRGTNPLIATNSSELLGIHNTTESYQLDNAELVYLDLLRMSHCVWLAVSEPLGRGSYSGTAALWSGKKYCSSKPWMLCDPKSAEAVNITTSMPWSDDEMGRLQNPKEFCVKAVC